MADPTSPAGKKLKNSNKLGEPSTTTPLNDISSSVKVTVTITATTAKTESIEYDHRFNFTLLSASTTTTPTIATWNTEADADAPSVKWTQDYNLNVDKELLLLMEKELITINIEQRKQSTVDDIVVNKELDSISSTTPMQQIPTQIQTPTQGNRKSITDNGNGKKKGQTTTNITEKEENPFTQISAIALPWSALLSPPHTCLVTVPSASVNSILPVGLSSLSINVHTNGVSPIHPSLLPQLLPLSITFESLTGLNSHPLTLPAFREVYRPLTINWTLPDQPHNYSMTTSYLQSEEIQFCQSNIQTVFLCHLSAVNLYALSQDESALQIQIHDRDNKNLANTEDAEREEKEKKAAEQRMIQQDRERLKGLEKKKPGKQQLTSPKAKKEAMEPELPPVVVKTEEAKSNDDAKVKTSCLSSIVDDLRHRKLDSRSNVYGVANCSLADLFTGPSIFNTAVSVSPVFPPPSIPLIPPQQRTNPYSATTLNVRFQLLHRLPSPASLLTAVPFTRMTIVMPYASNAYSRLYDTIIQRNEQACGVPPGHGGRGWLAQVKGTQTKSQILASTARNMETEGDIKTEKGDKSSRGAGGTKNKKKESNQRTSQEISMNEEQKESHGSDNNGRIEDSSKDEKKLTESMQLLLNGRPATSVAPADVIVAADHLTGVMITDSIYRWIIIEGLVEEQGNIDDNSGSNSSYNCSSSITAMRQLVKNFQQENAEVSFYYNPLSRTGSRQFSAFPLSLHPIRIHSPITTILQTANIINAPSFNILSTLATLSSSSSSSSSISSASSLFSLSALSSIEQYYGLWVSDADMFGIELIKKQKQATKLKKQVQSQFLFQYQQSLLQSQSKAESTEKFLLEKIKKKNQRLIMIQNQQQDEKVDQKENEVEIREEEKQQGNEDEAVTPTSSTTKKKQGPPILPSFVYHTKQEYQEQLKQLRKFCHSQSHYYYTYHLDYLHSSVPRYESMLEYEIECLQNNKKKWRTTTGFLFPPSNSSKIPLFSTFRLLSDSERELEIKEKQQQKEQKPSMAEVVDTEMIREQQQFLKKREINFWIAPLFPSLFDATPQTSIHLSGMEQVALEKMKKEKELEAWKQKLTVDDIAFHVLWKGQSSPMPFTSGNSTLINHSYPSLGKSKLSGLTGLLQDPPKKKSLKMIKKRKKILANGEIVIEEKSLALEPLPVSITNMGEWQNPSNQKYRDSSKLAGQEEFVRYFYPHNYIHRPKIK